MKNLEEFNSVYKNKLAFIIASGPSINDYDLSPLKNYVTFAVNSGYVAFPDADFFVSDDWAIAEWSYYFDDLKNNKKTVPLLYEDKLPTFFDDRAVFFRHRKGGHITDRYVHNSYDEHICQSTTSVGSAIHIAHIMGCSPIVLLGVDCTLKNGFRYFWEHGNKYKTPYKRGARRSFAKLVLKGKETDIDLFGILKYWNEASSFMNKLQIYNASVDSVVESFPKKSLQEILNEHGNRSK